MATGLTVPTPMPPRNTVALGSRVTIGDLDAVAQQRAALELAPPARAAMERCHAFVRELASSDTAVYGLTTGCGPLSGNRIDAAQRAAFQRNLIRSHAVTLGAAHPTAFVRAAITARAQVLALGCSGVEPAAADLLIGMLNAGVHPIVREVGGVGASGDLVELAQIALAALGEGEVELDGTRIRADEALSGAGLTPLQPRYREGLALINGTSFHTGVAAVLVARSRRVAAAAQVAAAMLFEALGGHRERVVAHGGRTEPAGQRAVQEREEGPDVLQREAGREQRSDVFHPRDVVAFVCPVAAAGAPGTQEPLFFVVVQCPGGRPGEFCELADQHGCHLPRATVGLALTRAAG